MSGLCLPRGDIKGEDEAIRTHRYLELFLSTVMSLVLIVLCYQFRFTTDRQARGAFRFSQPWVGWAFCLISASGQCIDAAAAADSLHLDRSMLLLRGQLLSKQTAPLSDSIVTGFTRCCR